ncbi:ABC transporter permease subunit [Dickeya lacustris]|uniref:ABC transporter permease subunit n=1 Tax=Dickeya lacustris TaxID=2259638 RepID=A0ABY8GAD1_9GAMM|nr:ABC transporter permease subunit [Dickeya lacustris]WFN56849.1 ABC transporter permease subunit [Dickeya lacustris]
MANTDDLAYRDKRRVWLDSLTRRMVVASAWLVLLALLAIFCYLLYVVAPLFSPPAIRPLMPVSVNAEEPTRTLGISDNAQWAYRITASGYGEFIALARGQTVSRVRLTSSPVIQAAVSAGEHPLIVLALADGRFQVVRPEMPLSAQATPQWRYPFGEQALGVAPSAAFSSSSGSLPLAVAEMSDELWLARAEEGGTLRLYRLSAGGEMAFWQTAATEAIEQLQLTPDGRTLYSLSGNHLTQWQHGEQGLTVVDSVSLDGRAPWSLSLLAGGHSLLLHDADGRLSQWFAMPGAQGPRLGQARAFAAAAPDARLIFEPRRRVFATLDAQGRFALFASKPADALLNTRLAAGAQAAAFSMQGRALLLETATALQPYQLDNAYPELGWRGLWQRLWYENYPAPDYVWQPTAADDSYQAKFSLVPLLTGTFKAALCAMVFATPLALAGAIYTACFMSASLRRWIKPVMEIMGALPTVVIGLIAALWLAPYMATYLSALLLIPFLWGAMVLGAGWLLEQLPSRWRGHRPGWDALWLIPAMVLMLALAGWLGPWLELRVLGQPLWQWLGEDFSQRNTLVAGIALGFALIPLIFSLAEDALFSVPARLTQGSLALGASAWQTLWRVVLPSASSGIFAVLMLSFGRAVGETMIVLMASGNTPAVDNNLLQGLRSLAANIAIEMPEAAIASAHYRVLFLAALVLFVFTFLVNSLAEVIRQRLRRRYRDEGEMS